MAITWTWQLLLNLFIKVGLIGLLLFAVLNPDMQQFEGKAMTGRAMAYPVSVVLVPIAFWFLRRRNPGLAYPHLLDAFFGMPFFIDTAGNALDLYDTITWWDDFNHFLNWAILTLAFGQLLLHFPYGKWTMAALAVGFGAVAGIFWEIAEYFTFVRNSPELATAYTDTLGDLALDTVGAVVAALITAWVLRERVYRSAPAESGNEGNNGSSVRQL